MKKSNIINLLKEFDYEKNDVTTTIDFLIYALYELRKLEDK